MQIDEILKLIKQEYKEKIAALALTGQAGAGKTHISGKIKSNGIPYSIMDFDWFFKLSRKERSRWLEEGKSISVEEWRKRADQNAWWNFQKANETIRSIKYSTEKTIIKNAYNRNDNGELSGTFEITPKGNGLLVVEDVPTILLDDIDIFIYVHADDTVRKDSIASGDGKARADLKAEERWLITQHFETKIFSDNLAKIDYIIDNSGKELRFMSHEELKHSLQKQKENLPELHPIYY